MSLPWHDYIASEQNAFGWAGLEFARVTLGLAGGAVFWLGLFDLVDKSTPPYTEVIDDNSWPAIIKFWVCLAVGLVLLVVTGTLFPISGIGDVDEDDDATSCASAAAFPRLPNDTIVCFI